MSAKKIDSVTEQKVELDGQKRAFMKKFGKYAAVGVGMSVLMGPGVSTANAYGGGRKTIKRKGGGNIKRKGGGNKTFKGKV